MFERLIGDMRELSGEHGTMSGAPGTWRMLTIILTKAGVHAVLLYRLAHFLNARGLVLLPELITRLNYFLTGAEIDCQAEIGPGFRLPHPSGVVIGRGVRIGRNVSVLQQVCLGGNGNGVTGLDGPDGYPTIEDGVWLFVGAKVLGPVTVGRNSCILADTVVSESVPPGMVYGRDYMQPRTGTFGLV